MHQNTQNFLKCFHWHSWTPFYTVCCGGQLRRWLHFLATSAIMMHKIWAVLTEQRKDNLRQTLPTPIMGRLAVLPQKGT